MNNPEIDLRKKPYTNNKMYDPKITVSHLLATISLAVSGLWYVSGMAADITLLQTEIRHQQELRISETNRISEDLQELKEEVKEELRDTRKVLNDVLFELRKNNQE